MAALVREARYVKANVEHNNNKFWYIREFADASCQVHFGRVGGDGARKVRAFGSQEQAGRFFEGKCREKEGDRKGYRRLEVLDAGPDPRLAGKQQLARAAFEQIQADCPETRALVGHLTEV